MNIDDHPAIAGQLGIQSIPAVIAFKDGQPVDGFMGARSREPDPRVHRPGGRQGWRRAGVAEALAAAAEARAAGDAADRRRHLCGASSQQAAGNVEAIAGLADLLFEAGDAETARSVLGAGARRPSRKRPARRCRARQDRLAEQAAALGNPAELEARLAANPADHQARFDLAMIQNAKGERDEAADHLLAIVKADRTWNDDGAQAQLLQFFEAWGMTDEATLAGRRKLSSLLFS